MATRPAAAARMGRPAGAAMSMPACSRSQRCPKGETTGPVTGQASPPAPIRRGPPLKVPAALKALATRPRSRSSPFRSSRSLRSLAFSLTRIWVAIHSRGGAASDPDEYFNRLLGVKPDLRLNRLRSGFAVALMSADALNRLFRGRRRHLAVVAVMVCLGATVAVHHFSPGDMGMADTAAHNTMVVCLGVILLVALAIATGLPLRLPRLRRVRLRVAAQRVVMAPTPRARSSPVATVVLRL